MPTELSLNAANNDLLRKRVRFEWHLLKLFRVAVDSDGFASNRTRFGQ